VIFHADINLAQHSHTLHFVSNLLRRYCERSEDWWIARVRQCDRYFINPLRMIGLASRAPENSIYEDIGNYLLKIDRPLLVPSEQSVLINNSRTLTISGLQLWAYAERSICMRPRQKIFEREHPWSNNSKRLKKRVDCKNGLRTQVKGKEEQDEKSDQRKNYLNFRFSHFEKWPRTNFNDCVENLVKK
jgi:hypothetical protein